MDHASVALLAGLYQNCEQVIKRERRILAKQNGQGTSVTLNSDLSQQVCIGLYKSLVQKYFKEGLIFVDKSIKSIADKNSRANCDRVLEDEAHNVDVQ